MVMAKKLCKKNETLGWPELTYEQPNPKTRNTTMKKTAKLLTLAVALFAGLSGTIVLI